MTPPRSGKDTFVVIDKLGSEFIPKLFALRRWADRMAKKLWFMPEKFTDYFMQILSMCWPNHLPRRMEDYRDRYEHHWVIEMADGGVDEARAYLDKLFTTAGTISSAPRRGQEDSSRFVAGSATVDAMLNRRKYGAMMTMDIAFPRNELKARGLAQEIDDLLEIKPPRPSLRPCASSELHRKKGVDAALKAKLLATPTRGAKYPQSTMSVTSTAQGETEASTDHLTRRLVNPGIGKTSKLYTGNDHRRPVSRSIRMARSWI